MRASWSGATNVGDQIGCAPFQEEKNLRAAELPPVGASEDSTLGKRPLNVV